MIMKKIFIKSLLIVTLIMGLQSCDERENYTDGPKVLDIVSSVQLNGKEAVINHLSGNISVSLSGDTNLSDINFDAVFPKGVTITPDTGSTLDLTSPVDLSVSNGVTTRHYIISAKLLPSKIAFIGDGATLNDISDDDVKAAGLWAQQVYGDKFVYIPFNQLTDGALDGVNVLFYMYDEVGSTAQPAVLLEHLNVVSKFFVQGGKIVAGGHGTGIVEELGRDTSGLRNILGSGTGGANPDTWGVGFASTALGSTISQGCQFYSDRMVYVINGGYKEDHNALWNLAPLDDPQFASFSNGYDAEVVAAWDWAIDGQGFGGIVLWKPSGRFQGYIMTLGIGGMEWSMNDGRVNPYADNIRTIYKNSIDYLGMK